MNSIKKPLICVLFVTMLFISSAADLRITASGLGPRYEAEKANLTGPFCWKSPLSSASRGYQVIGFSGFDTPTPTITFCNVYADQAGSYNLLYRYCNGYRVNSKINIYINNSLVRALSFAPTGQWSASWSYKSDNVFLEAGYNTILLKPIGPGNAINLDYIDVTKNVCTSPRYEAENAVLTSPACVAYRMSSTSGSLGKYVLIYCFC